MTRRVSRSLKPRIFGLRAAALLAALASATGCAQSIGDIDRTQPDLIAKEHFLDGQWFIRETVIDVPPTSPVSMIGDQGQLEQIVWDIQEDWLVGYRSYELVPGTDGDAEPRLAAPSHQPVSGSFDDGQRRVYKGNPVVAYRIDAHVDVQRGYNPRTGEQNNIIQENTTDRPWRERSFMRVDWSNNEVDGFLTSPRAFMPIFGASSTAAAFIPANEGGPDAFHMEVDEEGKATYIDFTVRRFVEPTMAGCVAMLNTSLGDCTGDEIRVRTSMLKVDVEREQEYVPLVYDDRRQGEFGYFRQERVTYDRKLGPTFSGLIQVANRHDLWENSRAADGQPLEYAARTLRPVTYVLSEHYPEEMKPVTRRIAEQYDEVFKEVVAAARGQSLDELTQDLLDDTGGTCLFCLDENEDNSIRIGDLRYNFIYWIDDPQLAGPLGYGPASANPETGRVVSGSAFVYGASVDRYAESAKQIVELMIPESEGGLTEEQVRTGRYYRDAVRGGLKPIDPRSAGRLAGVSGEEFGREVLGDDAFSRLTEFMDRGVDALAPAVPGFDAARMSRLVGTPLEARMIPGEWFDADRAGQSSYLKTKALAAARRAELLGQEPPDLGPMGHLSVLNWFGPDAMQEVYALEKLASERSLWLANFDDPSIAGLAREVADSGLQEEDLFQMLREKIFEAVMLHEIGHTVGLRHNFAGSADALNFHDGYWEQRVKTIEPVADLTQTVAPAPLPEAFLLSNCSVEASGDGQGAIDVSAACEEQRNSRMAEMQYSSIMDYGARFNADFHGLGRYDVAALAAGYGDLVEVFTEEAMEAAAQAGQEFGLDVREAALEANQVRNPVLNQGLDNALAFQGAAGLLLGHYTNYPRLFGGHENLAKRRFMPRTEYLELLAEANQMPASQRSRLPVKVPYLACYDEYVDSVETCHRWDQGADNYEIVANTLTAYNEYYVFNNFQRDRIGFEPFQVYSRVLSRYFRPLTNMYQHWFWNAAVTRLAQPGTPRFNLGAMATEEGLNTLVNTMSTPEYGAHVYSQEDGMYMPANGSCPEVTSDVLIPMEGVGQPPQFMSMPGCVEVPRGVGRSFFSLYDSSGVDVYRRVLESGHFYEQIAALNAMLQSNATVVGIGQDVAADSRTFRIPYNLVFADQIEDLFSSIYSEQDLDYGMHIIRAQGRPPEVLRRNVFLDEEGLSTLPVVRPGRSYTTRVQALVAGMNLLDGNLNATFAKQGQISLAGSGEQRVAPPGFDLVEVSDPLTGRAFVAYRKSDGTGGPWYAADLLDQARAIVEDPNASEQDIANVFGDVELVRLAYTIFADR